MQADNNQTPAPNFASSLPFELLFHELPPSPLLTLAERLAVAHGGDSFQLDEQTFHLAQRELPDIETRQSAISQSWNWREAAHVLGHCSRVLAISDEAHDWKDYRNRVATFRRVLSAAIRSLAPLAVHCVSSQQFIEPGWLADALDEEGGDEMFGFVNVRLYKFEGHEKGIEADYDETVMDTLGLGALGLPDLQAHFKHLDPSAVAQLLYSGAQYIFTNGPVIESGHNLQGFAPDQKWICQLEESIAEPHRLVIDLNPGRPYAAGKR